ncbi:cAMP-independent regulatory protein pac2 [Moelleriella libera RCEF 2490]|uniref:cAMP-independent regulatory protein pac2 n=1 Tax=Moelleriella libera RCEF 2490 TaxID=1081109 RepID=A0A167ZBD6_9HYPO|nr:cAMP-independent regulatory protein pac2 [Moelleriella libera RCEF 2490]
MSFKTDSISSDKMETYHGYVRTPGDAIKLFEACRRGLLPRVQRRLSEKERQSIRSGSVFVWDEREAGMRRWTDGKSWSASRVSGSFLTYREMEGKRGNGFGTARRGTGKTPDSSRGSDEDHDDGEHEGYRYKADGLMKQSFSITTSSGQHLHLISYYSRPQSGQAELPQPSSDPSLRAILPPKGMYPESSMGETNQTPALTRAPMQQPYAIAPHHSQTSQQAFPHYSQPGYTWPPSPAVTPPYSHYPPSHPYASSHQQLPPPYASSHPSHQSPPSYTQCHYTAPATFPPPPSHYERPSLPPLQPPQSSLPSYQAGLSPPRAHESPIYKERQGSYGLLPALNTVTSPATQHPGMTPPTRESSASPSVRSTLDSISVNSSGHRSSLSALLHPSDSPVKTAVNHGSRGGSPRGSHVIPTDKCGSEDTRALRMLDRKFCV